MSDTSSLDPFFNPKKQAKPATDVANIDALAGNNPDKQNVQPSDSGQDQTVAVIQENPVLQAAVTQTTVSALEKHAESVKQPAVSGNNLQQPATGGNLQPSAPTAPQMIAKQGTKISFKTFAIGCGVFFVVFLLLVIVGLYAAISNPSSLANLGLDVGTVKSILLIFTVLFFGLLFFAGFGFAALNGYRFFTVKEGSKLRYGLGFGVGFIVLIGSIALGLISYTRINAINEEQTFNTNSMLIPFVHMKKFDDGDPSLPYSRVYIGTQGLPLIAPSYVDIQLNRQIAESLGLLNLQLTRFIIDCGNGQIITNEPSELSAQLFFQGSCLYLKKGQYNMKMTYFYFDPQQGAEMNQIISNAATIDIATDYGFTVDGSAWKLNDNKNEVILGTAPTKLLVDAQKIFTDLNIPTIQIAWDVDGNGSVDKQNRVSYSYYFDEAKLYNSYFSIPLDVPGLPSQLWYMMRYRVNAGDVPPCELQTTLLSENTYEMLVRIDDQGTDIQEYALDIIDNQTDDIVANLKGNKARFEYRFANGKSYRIRGYFTTTEGKRGSCEAPDLLDIGYNSYSFLNTISVIGPDADAYVVLTNTGDARLEGDTIIITEIPSSIKLVIDKIVPEVVAPQISAFDDGVLKNPTRDREYVFRVESQDEKQIKLTLDDGKGKSAQKVYTVRLERKSLIGKLKANKTVGFDPLIVEFDASITTLNDPTDEVVYFTWDFGDGEIRRNTSVGKITHTYRFDSVKESGEFQPKVTVRTKKGLSQTIPLSEKVIVKRPIKTFDILIPSHPAQLARVGDQIDFSVQADGKVIGISWDFGNGKKLSGQGREFAEVSSKYDAPGTYDIYATLEFSDSPPVSQTIRLKVE